jgi:6-hydroxycyclohex-1-ene-1-carbonyl-CoA dehydrogenase
VRQVGEGVEASLVDRPVVIPAVLPCGECDLCRGGHRSICRRQVMPGNDRHGGFASQATVPARFLCPVPDAVLGTHELWELAVVSDAVATPFQAVRNSGLAPGELAVFVGVGGIGVHGVQVAAAVGAKVIALDLDDRKLEQARLAGAHGTLNVRDLAPKDVRKQAKALAESLGAPAHLWKVFEMSGTRGGQETAFGLLGFGASLAIVGFTMDRVEVPLSNLMAYEATARGNWGADPLVYPDLLDWIGAGRLTVKPFVERHPLDRINTVLDDAHHGRLLKRAVMVPGQR